MERQAIEIHICRLVVPISINLFVQRFYHSLMNMKQHTSNQQTGCSKQNSKIIENANNVEHLTWDVLICIVYDLLLFLLLFSML